MKNTFIFALQLVITLSILACKEKEKGKEPSPTPSPSAPTVTTGAINAITKSTATIGGNVTNEGSSSVTERGICYGILSNPTTSSSKINAGTGTGTYQASLTDLASNTQYYVRAYAINSTGTSYGEEKSFKTSCNEGYEGPSCVPVNQKYAGSFTSTDVCSSSGNASYTTTITSSTTDNFVITLTNLWEVPSSQVTAQLSTDGGSFTIERQGLMSGFEILSTNGLYNTSNNTITLTYTVINVSTQLAVDVCTHTISPNF